MHSDMEPDLPSKRQKLNHDAGSFASEVLHPIDIDMHPFESLFNVIDDDDAHSAEGIFSCDPIDQFAVPDTPKDLHFDLLENQVANIPKGDLKLVKGQSKKVCC